MKAQAALPSEGAVVVLLYGIIGSGQVHLSRIDGWRDLPQVLAAACGDELQKVIAQGILPSKKEATPISTRIVTQPFSGRVLCCSLTVI